MKNWLKPCLLPMLGAVILGWNFPALATQSAKARQIAHGKYLVDRVAGCNDCHSPHNQRGELIPGKELQGAELDFQPIHPVPGWMKAAPPIAGLMFLTTEQGIKLLSEGLAPDGKPPAPPMPQYHMTRADAAAVVAYLKSLKPQGK
jgi:mono/diheme cytochrome c family protein